jgi:hypothetical protein
MFRHPHYLEFPLEMQGQREATEPHRHLARIIHDGSSRKRAVAWRDGHAEPGAQRRA